MNKHNKLSDSVEFSLGEGGLLYQLYLKTRLAKKPLLLYKRRIVILCLITWLPLFILALFSHVAFRGVQLPFIYDIGVHIRFLVVLSLFIYADIIVNNALKYIVKQFTKSNIISLEDRQKFNSFIVSSNKLTNAVIAEIFILLFVIVAGLWISNNLFSFSISTWYEADINSIKKLTPAGYWYAFISLPLFQFLLLRWYYRIAIWYRFLWKVSRLPLQLNALHPDRAGGIGFLAVSVYAFMPILFAHTVLLSGIIFDHIFNEGATLSQFHSEIICIMVFLIIIPLLPLMFFTDSLIKIKQIGSLEYDAIASSYVKNFRQKWIANIQPKDNDLLLGTPDIQTLADLATSFQVSSQMRITPFNKNTIFSLIIFLAIPLLPLLLTTVPIDKIIPQTISFIFK